MVVATVLTVARVVLPVVRHQILSAVQQKHRRCFRVIQFGSFRKIGMIGVQLVPP